MRARQREQLVVGEAARLADEAADLEPVAPSGRRSASSRRSCRSASRRPGTGSRASCENDEVTGERTLLAEPAHANDDAPPASSSRNARRPYGLAPGSAIAFTVLLAGRARISIAAEDRSSIPSASSSRKRPDGWRAATSRSSPEMTTTVRSVALFVGDPADRDALPGGLVGDPARRAQGQRADPHGGARGAGEHGDGEGAEADHALDLEPEAEAREHGVVEARWRRPSGRRARRRRGGSTSARPRRRRGRPPPRARARSRPAGACAGGRARARRRARRGRRRRPAARPRASSASASRRGAD